jgi:hypothetical protein
LNAPRIRERSVLDFAVRNSGMALSTHDEIFRLGLTLDAKLGAVATWASQFDSRSQHALLLSN